MALAFTNLGTSANPDIFTTTNASSYANTSWTPPTTGIICCWVMNTAASVATIPTMSGNSLTWLDIGDFSVVTGTARSITLFAAIATGATTGVTTIDFAGAAQSGCIASFFQITGADEANGLAQTFPNGLTTNNGTGLSGSLTLAAAVDSASRPISGFAHAAVENSTGETNWTVLDNGSYATPSLGGITQCRSDVFDTAVSASWATSAIWLGGGAEVKALAASLLPQQERGHLVLQAVQRAGSF